LKYFLYASDEDADQALREAHEQTIEKDVLPYGVEHRKATTLIYNKWFGYLAEILLCKKNGWQRIYPPKHNQPDAFTPDGSRVEIETRTKRYSPISVKPCDLAFLMYYSEKDNYFQVLKRFERDDLKNRGWRIFLTEDYWQALVEDRLIRGL
jgi:hypothetical protein